MEKTRIGLVGCGIISDVYLQNLPQFDGLTVTACADIDQARAAAKAAQYGLRALPVDALLHDPEIELVVNLTVPAAHAEINLAALAAGKHAYGEKPLAVERADGRRILELAQAQGRRVGAAPDTFLGGGLQTCRQIIDAGGIGEPVGCAAFMGSSGPDDWHPNPGFFFQPGGGPLFDFGPYYLTALIHLLGPIKRVTGLARASFPERIAGHAAIRGQRIRVQVPTHVIGALEFASGPLGTLVTSFDIVGHEQPCLEIYGSEATLSVPDPNGFGGTVRRLRRGRDEWEALPLTYGYADNSRGLGVADLARAVRTGRPHRASGALAFHVLDLMHAIVEAAQAGRAVELDSQCERPAPLPLGLRPGQIDD